MPWVRPHLAPEPRVKLPSTVAGTAGDVRQLARLLGDELMDALPAKQGMCEGLRPPLVAVHRVLKDAGTRPTMAAAIRADDVDEVARLLDEPWERGPLARIPGEPRLAARHAGQRPALPANTNVAPYSLASAGRRPPSLPTPSRRRRAGRPPSDPQVAQTLSLGTRKLPFDDPREETRARGDRGVVEVVARIVHGAGVVVVTVADQQVAPRYLLEHE